MGVQTDVTGDKRANPAMVLGGLIEGVTPLEMAYAFYTLARDGERLSGTLATYKGGPVAMLEIKDKEGKKVDENQPQGSRFSTRASHRLRRRSSAASSAAAAPVGVRTPRRRLGQDRHHRQQR